MVKRSRGRGKLLVTADGRGVASHAGARLLSDLADAVGSPGAIFLARAATLSMNSLLIDLSTRSREPAAHTSPLP